MKKRGAAYMKRIAERLNLYWRIVVAWAEHKQRVLGRDSARAETAVGMECE